MHTDPVTVRHNIVLFGETGAGKSSIINMLRGSDEVPVSSKASGCTLSSTGYAGTICDQQYTFWDTAGLNETDVGKVPDWKAVGALYHLLQNLEGGVSLLVFCMIKPKSTWAAVQKNWQLFKEIICQNQVPVAIAVTHLDQVDTDVWWADNLRVFADHGVVPTPDTYRKYDEMGPWVEEADGQLEQPGSDVGVACITATKGKLLRRGGYMLQEEYDLSIWKLKKLIYESHLPIPWRVEQVSWFQDSTRMVGNWLCPHPEKVKIPGRGAMIIMERWGLTFEAAKEIIKILQDAIPHTP